MVLSLQYFIFSKIRYGVLLDNLCSMRIAILYKYATQNKMTIFYNKAPDNYINNTNAESSEILLASKFNDRVEKYRTMDAFCIRKDHKVNFESILKYRLLSSSKSDLGNVN